VTISWNRGFGRRLATTIGLATANLGYLQRCCEFESRLWRCVLDTTLCDKVCQWFESGRWYSWYAGFLPQIKLTATIWLKNCESGVKHHNPNYDMLYVCFSMVVHLIMNILRHSVIDKQHRNRMMCFDIKYIIYLWSLKVIWQISFCNIEYIIVDYIFGLYTAQSTKLAIKYNV
jgi:hypothetical protein